MLRTNKFEADFDRECTFFLARLKSRGYDVAKARQVMGRYDWCDKKRILGRKNNENKHKKQIVPLKINFHDQLEQTDISMIIRESSRRLNRSIPDLKLVLCFMTNRNMFRLRYDRFL